MHKFLGEGKFMDEKQTSLNGLTHEEIKQRVQAGKVNKAVDDQFKSNAQIIKENVVTYFNLIFLVLALLLVLVGAWNDLTFLPVIILNTVIGIVQEIRVNESLLTGESDEIKKTKDSGLMSGSFVVSDKAYARLEKVGKDSYISKLTLEAKKMGAASSRKWCAQSIK